MRPGDRPGAVLLGARYSASISRLLPGTAVVAGAASASALLVWLLLRSVAPAAEAPVIHAGSDLAPVAGES